MCQSAIPEELMLLLLKDGSRREAIELYRDETGVSRAEARRAVKRLAKQYGEQTRIGSYADVILVLLVVVSVLVGVLFP